MRRWLLLTPWTWLAFTACGVFVPPGTRAPQPAEGATPSPPASGQQSSTPTAADANTTATGSVSSAGSPNGTSVPNGASAPKGANEPSEPNGASAPAAAGSPNFFFSAYKDITINANWNTGEISTLVAGVRTPVVDAGANIKALTWAFATGECGNENWGGLAANQLVAANVAKWAAAGKKYILATGGAGGTFSCGSDAGFAAFVDRYASAGLAGVDFDIEAGQSPSAIAALVARVKAAQANPKYGTLRFSFTLATLGGNANPSLGTTGVQVMQAIAAAKLTGVYINLMTMDYGSASASNCVVGSDGLCDMGASAIQAAKSLQAQYNVPLQYIEITPMIGGNDVAGEVFSLADAATVAAYAKQAGLGGVHYWSLDRDNDCVQQNASPTCNSYGKAGAFGFLAAFMRLL